jgi:hypothetical protein
MRKARPGAAEATPGRSLIPGAAHTRRLPAHTSPAGCQRQQALPQQPPCSTTGRGAAAALAVQQPFAAEAPASQHEQRHSVQSQVPLSQQPQQAQASQVRQAVA